MVPREWLNGRVIALGGCLLIGVAFLAASGGFELGESEGLASEVLVSEANLASHWKFDEGTGNTTQDSSPNDLVGTLNNGAGWDSGKMGSAVNLDGTDDYITVPDTNALDITGEITLAGWIYSRNLTGTHVILYKGDPTDGTPANYYLTTTGDELSFGFLNSGQKNSITTTANLAINTWYHVAAVYNDTANNVKIYVNGVEVFSGTQSASLLTNAYELRMGSTLPSNQGTQPGFNGLLDDMRIYERVLSASEIMELYNLPNETPTPTPTPGDKPNIILIMTDDLSVNEFETAMANNLWPSIKQHIVDAGIKFTRSFVSTALCCPSRANFLTGQHSHNNDVIDNDPRGNGGVTKLDDTETVPVWLQGAGYRTGYVGKYLNGYGQNLTNSPKDNQTYIPPGWNDWQSLIDPTTYKVYNYKINDNGVVVTYGKSPSDYQTDVLKTRALDFITDAEANDSQPFYLQINPLAPHVEPSVMVPECSNSVPWPNLIRPAPRHLGTLPPNINLVHGPAYNEEDVSDKPSWLQALPPLTSLDIQCGDAFWRYRLEAMMSVDEMVGALVADLEQKGELDNTIIIFTSDNGYFFGEHRMDKKIVGYDEATNVPLAIRAPGYAAGQVSPKLVQNIDLAPTLIELAKTTMSLAADGRSLVPLLQNPDTAPWRVRVFGEYLGGFPILLGSTFHYVQTGQDDQTAPNDSSIMWSNGEREYYDLDADPYRLTSRHNDPDTADERAYLENLINQFKTCVGSACASIEN